MKPEELYQKEFGEADSIPKESVIRLLRHFAKVLEIERNLINQEVEKRIAERMPSNSKLIQEFEGAYGYLTNSTKRQIWRHSLWAIELFQSRLTKDGAESSQKTEGGGE